MKPKVVFDWTDTDGDLNRIVLADRKLVHEWREWDAMGRVRWREGNDSVLWPGCVNDVPTPILAVALDRMGITRDDLAVFDKEAHDEPA
jgi:hypothetical protein